MEQTSPNRHRTINSFEAYFAKDRFIKCGRGGSNIAFCGARIAAEASHALSDECSHFVARAWREIWLKEDYWAIWIGLGTVIIAYLFFANGSSIRWLAVTPAKWSDLSALGAHFQANYLRYIAQFLVFLVVFTFALTALGHKARDFVPSFTILYLLSLEIFVLGQ